MKIVVSLFIILSVFSCNDKTKKESEITMKKERLSLSAKDILGNPDYLAMSYGGYRYVDHDIEPTVPDLKEDLTILAAMGVKMLRTYKVHLPQASNLLKAISALKKENPSFEMYVMLGAWIDCKNAWTDQEPDHNDESERNAVEIATVVKLAKQYPDIVKVIAVGNEAMVKWATGYFVQPGVILKWVTHLQNLKKSGELPKELWITSSDNFASWGGGGAEYHVEELNKLIATVDFISVHTYPMLDTHYNSDFWGVLKAEKDLSDLEKIKATVHRAKEHAMAEYKSVSDYMKSVGIDKPIHIGETGWASSSDGFFGTEGSKAADEYKQGLYHKLIREWTNKEGISCFYFEAFNEPWKYAGNPSDAENHFGLFTVNGKAKYALWDLVDKHVFKGLTRNGQSITKTYNGNKATLMEDVLVPALAKETKIE